jgi:DNA polymerase III delta subunit
MIIKEFQLSEVIKSGSLPQFLLIYGPNEGLIRDDILKIAQSFRQKKETDEITINGNAVDENQNIIDEEIRSFSLFSESLGRNF